MNGWSLRGTGSITARRRWTSSAWGASGAGCACGSSRRSRKTPSPSGPRWARSAARAAARSPARAGSIRHASEKLMTPAKPHIDATIRTRPVALPLSVARLPTVVAPGAALQHDPAQPGAPAGHQHLGLQARQHQLLDLEEVRRAVDDHRQPAAVEALQRAVL